ncbi:MAG: hypothetical protein D6707_02145 [Bacteroidetes bacterium]|nr:MAG: hypothetical protein D6707_02145 [Bacteroidota bacterium]
MIIAVLKDLKQDVTDLKKIVYHLVKSQAQHIYKEKGMSEAVEHLYHDKSILISQPSVSDKPESNIIEVNAYPSENGNTSVKNNEPEENLSLIENEKKLIIKALEKHKGKRKYAAEELGISERTLYRKIKEYNLE